jgi:cell division protein FtsN
MNSYIKRLSLVAAAVTVVVIFILPSTTQADEFNLKTYISVNQPFQVPGAVLQPDTRYVIRRLDSNGATNHVVRVLNEDETEVLSTFFGISAYRLEPADETILTFMEVSPGYPKPVQKWFYPGRTIGYEFIYPKDQMSEIASHRPGAQSAEIQTAQLNETETFTQEAQPQEEVVTTPQAQTTDEAVVDESTQTAQTTDTEIQREKPTDTTSEEAVAPAPADEDNEAAEEPAEETLPSTAGELSLLGLLGLASLGLRLALKR